MKTLFAGICCMAALSWAQEIKPGIIPDKSRWIATTSGIQEAGMEAANAVDGNLATRWSSQATNGQWLQVDIGAMAVLSGLTLHWEAAYPTDYHVELSSDGQIWQRVYHTARSDGKTDEIYFNPTSARFFRITGNKRSTSFGCSLWEVEAHSAAEAVQISIAGAPGSDPVGLLDGRGWQSGSAEPASVVIQFPTKRPVQALRIDWGGNPATAYDVLISANATDWTKVSEVRDGRGGADLVRFPTEDVAAVRLDLHQPRQAGPFRIETLAFKRAEHLTPTSDYQLATENARPGLYPEQFRKRQVFWTVTGLPAGKEKSALDEYGDLEPRAGDGTLVPFLYVDGKLVSFHDAGAITQALEENYLPIPSVEWPSAPVRLRIAAVTTGGEKAAATYLRYTLTNASPKAVEARLYLAIRPVQINPTWQGGGGLSPIRTLEFQTDGPVPVVAVNGRATYLPLIAPTGFGSADFNRGDVVRYLELGQLPAAQKTESPAGLASGALSFAMSLPPGESRDIVVAAPLWGDTTDALRCMQEGAAQGFATRLAEAKALWTPLLNKVVFDLPDPVVQHTLQSQLAYILINMEGIAIQPGSRNYRRTWIRDGFSAAQALMRFGVTKPSEKYVSWYAQRILPDGLVPPVLNTDGTVNTGFGSNLEYDSQGEMISAIMEYYRLTGDREYLARHFEIIRSAMRFIVELRRRTMAPDYLSGTPARERFVGLVPKSISHEGYNPPAHSYWDDYWALRGLEDAAVAADLFGDQVLARQAREEFAALHVSLRTSVDLTMAALNIRYIPGCAEKGDFDATSTSVLLSAAKLDNLFSPEQLRATYDTYFDLVKSRLQPGWDGTAGPYEVRNIAALAAIGMRDRANELMDYLLSHRRPQAWNHWAEVINSDPRLGCYIGDMPHTWVGSEFVNSVRQLVVDERGDKLVLLQGAPAKWLDGAGIRLAGLPTYFGQVGLTARRDGRLLTITLSGAPRPPGGVRLFFPPAESPKKILVDGHAVPWSGGPYFETTQPFETVTAEY